MAAATESYVTWRGLDAHLEVQFTFAHGIRPSQCQIQIPPDPDIDLGGTLTLVSGGARIQFPDCRADLVDVQRNNDGLEVWTVTVLDRRWKWSAAGNAISGYYNVRDPGTNSTGVLKSGFDTKIRKGTEKTIRELMKLCLDAMGETKYDLSKVPDDSFPEVEWEYTLPAEALAKLADGINCRVVLRPSSNTVAILPDGEGQKLIQGDALDYALTYNPPERPDELRFVGQRALFEADIPLEPVARNDKFEYVSINDKTIAYRPKVTPINGNYWWHFDPTFAHCIFEQAVEGLTGVTKLRDLAKADIYRKYRLKLPLKLGAGGVKEVTEIKQLLPLLSKRIKTLYADGRNEHQPAVVWGQFYKGEVTPDLNAKLDTSKVEADGTPPKELIYQKGIQLDVETGIVTLDEPTYLYAKKPGGIKVGNTKIDYPVFMPANIYLRTAFGVRDTNSLAWHHREVSRRMPGRQFGTKPHFIRQDDVQLAYVIGKGGKVVGNPEKPYDDQAKFYLDKESEKYQVRDPVAVTYPGLRRIDPDGAIQQITWSITESGATTRVSRNREEPVLGLTYAEQRLYQQLDARLKRDDRAKAEGERQQRRPA